MGFTIRENKKVCSQQYLADYEFIFVNLIIQSIRINDRYHDPPSILMGKNKRRSVNIFGEKGPEK